MNRITFVPGMKARPAAAIATANEPTTPPAKALCGVIDVVAIMTGIPAAKLTPDTPPTRNRDRFEVSARRVAMWVMHADLGLSYKEIADLFGYQTHSTVMDGIALIIAGTGDKYLPEPAHQMRREIVAALGGAA